MTVQIPYLVTANLVEVAIVHNCDSHRQAIQEAQAAVWQYRPKLWEQLKECEWLASTDIPPQPTKPLVELL